MTQLNEVPLPGLDGANPLAFLAALGTLQVATSLNPEATIHWKRIGGRISPVLSGLGRNPNAVVETLQQQLQELSTDALEGSKKLPFAASQFREFLNQAARKDDRRNADFGCALGSELYVREGDATFNATAFRMVRSKDTSGNGMTAYATKIRQSTTVDALERTLLREWDYADGPPGLRWDPAGDVPYAYGWSNPAKTSASTMTGANSLAIEGLLMFPTTPGENTLQTTAFHRIKRQMYLTWPLWSTPVRKNIVRSLLTLPELANESPDRQSLSARSIFEVYRCRRYASSQYYSNFTPAESV